MRTRLPLSIENVEGSGLLSRAPNGRSRLAEVLHRSDIVVNGSMQIRLVLLICLGIAVAADAAAPPSRVLVYTRSFTPDGKGYVHANIADSVEAIRKLGQRHGFEVDHSAEPEVFTDQNLSRYGAIIFSNSNNEAFANDAQRAAFERYIRSGGGFLGIHSASGSERKWPFFWTLTGGRFVWHPKLQSFRVRKTSESHPGTDSLPAEFEWSDEIYHLDERVPDVKVLLTMDPAEITDPRKEKYPTGRYGDPHALAWYQERYGGRQFYTSLGHKPEHYTDPILLKHLLGGITWVLGKSGGSK
jgi:type 1 glutamine amidotransferase